MHTVVFWWHVASHVFNHTLLGPWRSKVPSGKGTIKGWRRKGKKRCFFFLSFFPSRTNLPWPQVLLFFQNVLSKGKKKPWNFLKASSSFFGGGGGRGWTNKLIKSCKVIYDAAMGRWKSFLTPLRASSKKKREGQKKRGPSPLGRSLDYQPDRHGCFFFMARLVDAQKKKWEKYWMLSSGAARRDNHYAECITIFGLVKQQ